MAPAPSPDRIRVLAVAVVFLVAGSAGCGSARGQTTSVAAVAPTMAEALPSPYDIGCTDFLAAPADTQRGAVPSMSATIDVPPRPDLPDLVIAGCTAHPDVSVGTVIHDEACGVVTTDPPGTQAADDTAATAPETPVTDAPVATVAPTRFLPRAGGGSGGGRSGSGSGSGSGGRSSGGGSGSGSGSGSGNGSSDDDEFVPPSTAADHTYRGC